MKNLAVAFTGPSNSGKTTLIEKVAKLLISQNQKVSIIKNDPKDKAKFDIEGKDSYKFFQTGANVVVTSPTRTTMFFNEYMDLDRIIDGLGDFDFLLVEGLKNLPLPRIGVFRGEINLDYLDFIEALAVDNSIDLSKYSLRDEIEILDLNSAEMVLDWILKNGKEVR